MNMVKISFPFCSVVICFETRNRLTDLTVGQKHNISVSFTFQQLIKCLRRKLCEISIKTKLTYSSRAHDGTTAGHAWQLYPLKSVSATKRRCGA